MYSMDPSHYGMDKPKDNKYSYLKNGIFWDVTPCGSCKNRRFGGA
jgi:hypothetical protein